MFSARFKAPVSDPSFSEVVFVGAVGTNTTGSWTVPTGVTSVCILCVGGGESRHNGGGGGALSYSNAVSVTPGESLSYQAGKAGSMSVSDPQAGGDSFVKRGATTLVMAQGGGVVGAGLGGSSVNGVGTAKYSGGACSTSYKGGGGAAGYAGNGGAGDSSGAGGGGGGGGHGTNSGSGGGGVGLYGQGGNGAAGTTGTVGTGGSGGSGGTSGGDGVGGAGGAYGGGSGGNAISPYTTGNGGPGAVRILWGTGRAFPATNVDPS